MGLGAPREGQEWDQRCGHSEQAVQPSLGSALSLHSLWWPWHSPHPEHLLFIYTFLLFGSFPQILIQLSHPCCQHRGWLMAQDHGTATSALPLPSPLPHTPSTCPCPNPPPGGFGEGCAALGPLSGDILGLSLCAWAGAAFLLQLSPHSSSDTLWDGAEANRVG